MAKLIGIGQVAAIPRQQKIALVKRCQCQVHRISDRIVRHHLMPDVRFNDLLYLNNDFHKFQ